MESSFSLLKNGEFGKLKLSKSSANKEIVKKKLVKVKLHMADIYRN